jgi:hypothetical protein
VSRADNEGANILAQQASGYDVKQGKFRMMDKAVIHEVLDVQAEGGDVSQGNSSVREVCTDWRQALRDCIKNLGSKKDRNIRRQSLKYTIIGDELYR